MHSGRSSVIGWKTAGTGLAVLTSSSARVWARSGWAQEPAQSRIEEEKTFQRKNSIKAGATDVPDGYVTNRGLSDYAGLLPSGFCDALGRLGTSDRWLDIGAGAGQAILDDDAPPDPAARRATARRPARRFRANAIAMSIEDRRTAAWHQLAAEPWPTPYTASLSGKSLRALFTRRARKISDHYRRVRRLLLYRKTCPGSWKRC